MKKKKEEEEWKEIVINKRTMQILKAKCAAVFKTRITKLILNDFNYEMQTDEDVMKLSTGAKVVAIVQKK